MYADLKGLLTKIGITGRSAFNILLAVSEAFTNALVHANKYDSRKSIAVSIEVNKDALIADIIDEGGGEPDDLSGEMSSDPWMVGGRGVALMKTVADTVTFKKNTDTGGIQVRMKFGRNNIKKDIKFFKNSRSGG